ncbi:MAG: hypothetical protein JXR37_11985 [Kiritimatiellae bacterium]|nr:hypothetical protein [Kiritimatiellia bacterium]
MSASGNSRHIAATALLVFTSLADPAGAAGYRPPPEGQTPATALNWTTPRPPRPAFDTAAGAAFELGGLSAAPAFAVYLVVGDAPVRGRALIRNAKGDRAMLRVFDAEERLTHWQYVEPGLDAPICHPRDAYVDGLPPPAPAKGESVKDALLDAHVALVGRGVHQLRVQTGTPWTPARLVLTARLPFGVSFQNGDFSPWQDCPNRLYAYVPPRAERLELGRVEGAVRVLDDRNRVLCETGGKGAASVQVERTDCLWTFEFPDYPRKRWKLRAWGFPLILCTTPEAARAIRASVEVLPDGSVVSHKFQRRIAELLPAMLAPRYIGKADELIVPLSARKEAWLRDPRRNRQMFVYGASLPKVAYALRRQIVDPTDPWSGKFYKPSKASASRPPWDGYLPVGGFGGSVGGDRHAADALAHAALLDEPINPYYGKTELFYRAAAACLRDLLALSEAEVWPKNGPDPYPGGMVFELGQLHLPPFGAAAPWLPDPIRAVWAEAVRRMVDRAYTDPLVTCRNQSAHHLVSYAQFARGTQDPVYDRLCRLWARRFAAGAQPAGYHMEATGPCGSYSGLTHGCMAMYYRLTGDRAILDSLAKSYRFFNHTVAPEPAGGVLGGFNFNCRIGEGPFGEQGGGAKGLLDDALPEVGLWAGWPGTPEKLRASEARARETILKQLEAEPKDFPGGGDWRFVCFAKPDTSGVWPALEPAPFMRDFNGELLAVKRPGYYAVVFTGKPMAEWAYRGGHNLRRKPMPGDAENTGKPMKDLHFGPICGGGLSLFWTPAYGAALMAANWSALSHHGLVAFREDGLRDWEEYHATKADLDAANSRLTMTGRIASLPLRYTRIYRFEPDRLTIDLTVEAETDVALARLIENVPLAAGRAKSRGAEIAAPEADAAAQFTVADSAACGVRFELAEPRPLHVCRSGPVAQYGNYQINRVEIALPATLKKGESARLAYRLAPVGGPVASAGEP